MRSLEKSLISLMIAKTAMLQMQLAETILFQSQIQLVCNLCAEIGLQR